MSHGRVCLAVGLLGGLIVHGTGCLIPVIEGVKGGHVATEGEYKEITPIAKGALAKYKGYKVGPCSWKPVTMPADTKEADKAEIQKQIDDELKMAKDVAKLLPARFDEYMVDDAELPLDATPALLASVKDVRVTKRHGVVAVALPKVEVEAIVTLADAATGQVLGVATVSGHTSSLVLGTPRQLANFICRGTAKWINESRLAK